VNFALQVTKVSMTEEGLCIQGTSVCNGIATGRACVALTLEETADIKPGDILITNATDIGWSPFFPLLGGVVTELGGLISHGAVVAREYGLPCIVSAENATRKFRTGECSIIVSFIFFSLGTFIVLNEMYIQVQYLLSSCHIIIIWHIYTKTY
jgi:phosphoenolpyruvate synthase/pyruvate phosphate dikinase